MHLYILQVENLMMQPNNRLTQQKRCLEVASVNPKYTLAGPRYTYLQNSAGILEQSMGGGGG